MSKILTIVALICTTTMLLSCTNEKVAVQEFNKEGVTLEITVRSFPKKDLMHNFAIRVEGKRGEAVYSREDNKCDIVVLNKYSGITDGKYATLLGHELMHCLYGDYHK